MLDGAEHTIPIETSGWPSHNLMNWIARILLEERGGYNVTFNRATIEFANSVASATAQLEGCPRNQPACSPSLRLRTPKSFVSLEVWPHANPLTNDIGSKEGFVENLGASGAIGRSGWFVNNGFVNQQWQQRSIIVDDYRTFTKAHSSLLTWFEGATSNSTINGLAARALASRQAGCSRAEASSVGCSDGWYHPPWCASDPTQCATLFAFPWESSHRNSLAAKIRATGVNISAVWLDSTKQVRDTVMSRSNRHKPVLFQVTVWYFDVGGLLCAVDFFWKLF